MVYQKVYKPIRLRPVMEVIAIIMVAFAALLAVERKPGDADPPAPNLTPEAAYRAARRAARENGILARGRFKIAGEYGDYKIREKLPMGCATHGSVHTLRQAKEWLWCLHHDFDYEACKRAHKNRRARLARRDREYRYGEDERRRDLALQAAEMGFHDFSEDARGRRTYYPSETFPRYY